MNKKKERMILALALLAAAPVVSQAETPAIPDSTRTALESGIARRKP